MGWWEWEGMKHYIYLICLFDTTFLGSAIFTQQFFVDYSGCSHVCMSSELL